MGSLVQSLCNLWFLGILFFKITLNLKQLVSMFSKQFSKLTSQLKGNRFCYAKSSVMKSSSMEFESSRLDFPDTTKHYQTQRLREENEGASLSLPPSRTFAIAAWVQSGLFFFFVWSRFLGFSLLGLGFFFVWSLYGNWVYNARFPCIELKLVMLDLAQQNRVPHTRNVSLLNSFENMLTNKIVWVLVLFWRKKNPGSLCHSIFFKVF